MDKPTLNFITSWDDGDIRDLQIADLLRKYDLPGIFYIPSVGQLDKSDIVDLAKDFEIGGHTVSHPEDMKLLAPEMLDYEIRANKYHLEDCIGRAVDKFAYPSGRYNERTIEALKKVGYKYARTTLVGKVSGRDDYRQDTSVHVYPRKEYMGMHWADMAAEMIGKARAESGVFHLWGHAADLDSFNYWKDLERFFKLVSENYTV